MTARYMDLSKESYYSGEIPHLSQSIAHTLLSQSPAHAHSRHPLLGAVARTATPDMETGTMIHQLVLGAGDQLVVLDHDEYRTKEAKADRDAARADGKVPVKRKHWEPAKLAAERLRDNLADHGVVLSGTSEVAIEWHEGEVLCRGKLDHLIIDDLRGALIVDLKTCASAHPTACAASSVRYGYDVQRAAYVSAVEHLHPELAGRIDFLSVFVELEPPFAVLPCRASGIMRELGARKWERAVRIWAECLRTQRWPGYAAGGAVMLDPPAWALADLEEAA